MEVRHEPADPTVLPLEVTFAWREVQADDSLVARTHTEVVAEWPHRYAVNVGGEDLPVLDWIRVRPASREARSGYSDGRDAGGERRVGRWVTYGKNLARGKPYTLSVPSRTDWDAGDASLQKLTDGVVGPPYAGGTAPMFAACWAEGQRPEITVDLGAPESCGAFRVHLSAGWPWWDALRGEVKDRIEVETSEDGREFAPRGEVPTRLRWKDIPVNWMMPDDETAQGPILELILPEPVKARWVRFRIVPARILTVSEVQVLDGIRYEPFDLRIALPGR
jgi:hypothetical protein